MRRNTLWYARITAVSAWFGIATVFQVLRSAPFGKNSKNNLGYVRLVAPLSRKILGLTYTVKTPPNYKTHIDYTQAVFIMNHQAALDILSNMEVYPSNCIVIVKKALMNIPFFGWVLALGDNISLERSNPKNSMARMSQARKSMQEKKQSVWIFPEGTRHNTGNLHPFKHGAFHLAMQTGAPIVPVVISSYKNIVDFNKWDSGHIIIEVLEPIASTPFTSETREQFVAQCHHVMAECLKKNNAEIAKNLQRSRATASQPAKI